MDVAKVKSSIEAVRAELVRTRDAAIAAASARGAGADAIRQLNGIQELGRADALLDKVVSRLDHAVKRTAAKTVKPEKDDVKLKVVKPTK